MDLKNLSGAASGLGDKLPGMGGHGADGMMGKLFPDTGRKTSEEEFGKMQECAKMLEKYVARVPKESGCINMDSPDAERWKNDFFKNLVHGGPELLDDQFYTGDKTAKSMLIHPDSFGTRLQLLVRRTVPVPLQAVQGDGFV